MDEMDGYASSGHPMKPHSLHHDGRVECVTLVSSSIVEIIEMVENQRAKEKSFLVNGR